VSKVPDVLGEDVESLAGIDRRLAAVLRASLVSDALDALGARRQCLGWEIEPLRAEVVLVGRAFPCVVTEVLEPSARPYEGLLNALDAIGPGEVFVAATNRSTRGAVWGELLSTTCLSRGAVGAVTDGLVRDVAQIRELGFPVYARGSVPYDSHGRFEVTAIQTKVIIDDVEIEPGTLIIADDDGIVVVPRQLEAEVLQRAVDKAGGESEFRHLVLGGVPASEAFRRTGVL
jgi:regulator of RNase E activity RraA